MKVSRKMARWLLPFLTIVFFHGMPSMAADVPQDVLTLEESLRIALEKSPRALVAASQERQSEAQVDEARSMLLPGFNLSGGVERTNLGQMGPLPDPESELNVTLAYNQVFNWSKEIRLTLEQSELGRRLAGLQQESERLAVVTDVVNGYVGVLEAMSALEFSRTMARNSAEGARIAADRFDVGTATEADVIAAEAAMARAQQGVRVAEDSVALARDALFQTIGLKGSDKAERQDARLESIDELADSLAELSDGLDALVDRALASRVEVLQAELALHGAKLALEQFEASSKPRAELTGMYAWKDDGPTLSASLSDRGALGVAVSQSHVFDETQPSGPPPGFPPSEDMWQIGARITWNLSDGGAKQSRRKQLTEQVRQAELRLDDLQGALSMQLAHQYNEVVHAFQELAVAEQELLEAGTRYQATWEQLESGGTTQVALWQAEGDEVRARHGRTMALGRLVRAQISLAAATGVTAEEVVSLLSRRNE